MTKEPIDENLDYYSIFEIPFGASDGEIKKQYYALTKKYHPDSFPEGERDKAGDHFALIQKVYTVLKDKEMKARVDIKYEAKRLQKEKLEKMDVTKRKLREELEFREGTKKPKNEPVGDLDKLREENFFELMKKKPEVMVVEGNKSINIEWVATKTKITESLIRQIFKSLFGEIESVVVNIEERRGVLVFKEVDSARAAAKYGWKNSKFDMFSVMYEIRKSKEVQDDYEDMTLIRLRQAAERQRMKTKE